MSNNKKPNITWCIIKAFWTAIVMAFIALTIFVCIKQNLYQNTWKDLTKKDEISKEETNTPETVNKVEVDLKNETVTIR